VGVREPRSNIISKLIQSLLRQLYNMLTNKYYIIRTGDFATNGNKKIYYSLFSVCLCLEEYISLNSMDCFHIMVGSTFVWTIIECILHHTKTRVIKPMYVTGLYRQYQLPQYIGIFLQGFQEGGVVTTFGLYFGDRLFDLKSLILFHAFIAYIISNMNSKHTNVQIASKRHINNYKSLIIMGTIAIYNAFMLCNHHLHVRRQLQMAFAMTYVCSIWTYIAYKKGFRTVEIQIPTHDGYIIKQNTYLDAILILGYDVIFEITIAYLTFYNWFII